MLQATHPESIPEDARQPQKPTLSVLIPVSERHDDVRNLYEDYKDAIRGAVDNVEFLYVLDGPFHDVLATLSELRQAGEPIRIVRLAKRFGEATALSHGIEHARSDTLLILPAYYQVEPSSLTAFLGGFQDDDAVIVARRWPRVDSLLNRLGTTLFHRLLRAVTGQRFRDVGCGVRLVRRAVFDEINLYGDQHRFLAMLASQRGFRAREIDLPQARQDPKFRLYRPSVYLSRVLDLLAVFFLVRFTKRPLRFFGLVGSALIALGIAVLGFLVIQRFALGISLGDRPAMLLGALLLVLGVQLFALGLIGELIIFTHARHLKEYAVAEIINFESTDDELV